MIVKGIVEEIIFRNGDNNYTVLLMNCNGEMITAVGKFPAITEGECLELTGNFTAHSKYGEQFSVTNVKLAPPTTKEGIVKYLSSGLIKGIGIITATNIVNKFGESTLDIIEYNPSRLAEIRGISDKKAQEIGESFAEVKKMQNAVMLMQHHNISTNLAIKIYTHYGNSTEEILKTNPYKLVEDVDGIGFFTADKIAQSLGIKTDSEFRFRAGVLHALKDNCDKSGNTYMTKANLESNLATLLRLNVTEYSQVLDSVLSGLSLDTLIRCINKDDDEIVVLTKYYNLEKYVAATLKLFAMNEITPVDVEGEIEIYEKLNGIKLHSTQKDTIKMAINNGISVITGGPGTGKTTIIKCILYIFNNMCKKVKLLAPTGRAAKRMTESCELEASTIHRALELDFGNSNMFKYNNLNKLPYDVIVVDEVSMVDVQLMYYLLRAVKRGAQIVLVGDKDQLPSVGAGNVLADILASGVVPFLCLTQIYRQNENSLIVTNAHAINNGQMPVFDNKSSDFFYLDKNEPDEILSNIIDMCVSRIPKFLGVDSSHVQVLAPMKAGICGIDNINKCLQQRLNPPKMGDFEIATDRYTYRKNDRVMQITNNYERVTYRPDGTQSAGVFNGDIGTIVLIDIATQEITVEFEDGRLARYVRADLGELTLSYAITIHKSQGSEFDCVVMPVIGGPPMLLTRNLLYTGVTRAKKMVVLIGSKVNVRRMVKNNHTLTRYTLLKDFLTMDEGLFNE